MRKFILTLLALTFSMSIFAHGPTPQKVQESITVSVTPAKAWSTVKDFSSFKKIMKIRSFDDEIMKIKYEMLKKDGPFSDYNAYIIVKKGANDNESVIQWTARFYRIYKLNPPIPEGQDDATAKAAVKKIVESGLANLKKSLASK
ncbi:SRPBCC family protein [Methylophilaceae bacterium]|nr:SRPBCC family protein [Methylophilaceae bacterium]|tara:strand:+ start:4063 stop:4497 length:435 start_codon:yes stop_codon:yes gene_type:complete